MNIARSQGNSGALLNDNTCSRDTTAYYRGLKPSHAAELKASCISLEIAEANFRSIDGEEFERLILHEALAAATDKSGSFLTSAARRLRQRHAGSIDEGGWYCAGADITGIAANARAINPDLSKLGYDDWAHLTEDLTSLPVSDWGCFKSDKPRIAGYKRDKDGNWQKAAPKIIGYEHPAKTATKAFLMVNPGNPKLYLNLLCNAQMPVIITEGAKKAAALTSAGYDAIGLPGISQWNKPKTRELIDEIAVFARKGREIYIAFDQDIKKKTQRAVAAETCKLAGALRKAGCTVKVIQWESAKGKGIDDLIASAGIEAFENAYNNAMLFEYWSYKYLSRMTYPVSYTVPKNQRYIDGAHNSDERKIPFPDNADFMALKAPKGTGKTEAIKRVVGMHLGEGYRVLFLTHRVQLTQALCDRSAIPSIYEIVRGRADESQGYGLCVQSLHPESQAQFSADEWQNALIIMDEVEQMQWDLLESSTCKKNRVPILREMRELIRNALDPMTEGKLIIADADLSNVSIDTIRGIAGDDAPMPWVVESRYKGTDSVCDITVFQTPQQQLQSAEQRLDAGEKIIVVTDSQKAKAAYSSKALEDRWSKKYPTKRIARIDSETLADASHPCFGAITMLNAMAGDYDILICSPSVETGVSIDLRDHFDAVIGFFCGVMAENTARQSLARLRDNVPRELYAATRGLSLIGGGEYSAEALIDSRNKQARASVALIEEASRDDINSGFLAAALTGWSRYAARQNAGMSAYRDIIIGGLREEGHSVTFIAREDEDDQESLSQLNDEAKSERHDRLLKEAEEVIAQPDLTDKQVARLERASSVANKDEQQQLAKAILTRMYPGHELSPDLYIVDQWNWWSHIKLHYSLTTGREYVKGNDAEKIKALMNPGGSELWGNDIVRSTLSMKVSALEFLKVDQLIKKDELSAIDPDVIALAESAYHQRRNIKGIFGMHISERDRREPLRVAKKFMNSLGIDLGAQQQRTVDGKRVRFYQIEIVDYKFLGGFLYKPEDLADDEPNEYDSKAHVYFANRDPVFDAWLAKDIEAVAKRAEKTASEAEMAESIGGVGVETLHTGNELHTDGNNLYTLPTTCVQQNDPVCSACVQQSDVSLPPSTEQGGVSNGASPAQPLTGAEEVLLWRLMYATDMDQYRRVRSELETYHPDFEGHYWRLLPGWAQTKICNLPEIVTVTT